MDKLEIVIKDGTREYLRYSVEQFIEDFATQAAKLGRVVLSKEKRRKQYFELAHGLLRAFKRQTRSI